MDLSDEIKELSKIHVSWRDYALMMLNSTHEPLRSIWREKLVSSITRTIFNKTSIFESNLVGLEVLSHLPDTFTMKVVDDSWNYGDWKSLGRLSGSKRMSVVLGHYPQETTGNEALLCLQYVIDHWSECKNLIFGDEYLHRMWEFSQKSRGEVVYPDEVLTRILERDPVNGEGEWLRASEDILSNGIPSKKFEKYYFSEKLKGFPFSFIDDEEIQKEYFLQVSNKILKEDISSIPSWKRICICILKNDVLFSYAGFQRTWKEIQARDEALKMFNERER